MRHTKIGEWRSEKTAGPLQAAWPCFFQWLCVCVCIESVASQEALQSHLILPISIDLSWVDELWITQFCVFLFGNHFNGYRTRGRYNRDIQQASKVPKLPIQNVSIPNCEGEYCTNFKTFKRSFEGLGNYFSYNSCHVQVQNHLFLQADLYFFFSVHTAHPWYLIQIGGFDLGFDLVTFLTLLNSWNLLVGGGYGGGFSCNVSAYVVRPW